ncbi:MAG: vitamin B12-dependent ribonucleotide reductase [Candidatus Nitrospinota bacterium M3_3B_026]
MSDISFRPDPEEGSEPSPKSAPAAQVAPSSPELSENAVRVLERRYLRKNERGEVIETPADMFRRVARNIAQAEVRYGAAEDAASAEEEFYSVMASLEFMPNSPTLMNAGRELQQLSACFVLPVDDSMESIFDAVRDTALIHKSGGGTGFSFSRLRPAGSQVKSTNGVSSGPVSFMKVFDAATESVKQGGTRRGANMGILRVDHPDIEDFIDCKRDNTQITNFNISVALTDKFMKAVENGEEYDLVAPHTGQTAGSLDARKVFGRIVESAWRNGDPGIIFIDRVNRDNPTPHVGEIESTNPCGEQPLLPYESCNLGSVNLSRMVAGEGEVNWERLRRVVHTAVRFLDNVIDMNKYPLDKISQLTRANRKIGLGVMGWADMLIKLGVPYNSEEATALGDRLMEFIDGESKKASMELARKRGAFPNFPGSIYDKPGAPRLRNATTTTIAPTGTISIIAGCSSGIEPLFALSFVRTVMDKDRLVEVHPLFEKTASERGFYSDDLMEKVAYQGHIEDMEELPKDIREVFVTAHGVSPEWHIRTQAAFQKHTDNAVSKTVNFPREATKDDVRKVYTLAHQLGLKGVTIYRDGSRNEQVLTTGAGRAAEGAAPETAKAAGKVAVRPRPDTVYGLTQRITTGCGSMFITINMDEEGRPLELFSQLGKAGGCAASQTESIGRLVSLALRAGVDVSEIQKQLMGISCHQPAWDKGIRIASCADAIGKALGRLDESRGGKARGASGNGAARPGALEANEAAKSAGACPDCGSSLRYADGCLLCSSCGYSKC